MKYTPGDTAITTFTIASTELWKNGAGEPQEHTEWHQSLRQTRRDRSRTLAIEALVSFSKAGNAPSRGTTSSPAARVHDILVADKIGFLHSSPVPECVPSPSIVTLQVTRILPVTISGLRLLRVMLFIVTVS
jgi:hypothetical protein